MFARNHWHKKNLVCVPSPEGLVSVLRNALGMAIVKVPKNAALMAVDMFARNHWSIWMLWRNEGFYVLPVLSLVVASVLSFVVYVEDA
mmetsp:Transcript_24958/g.40661  ORF Transcript_24958/g.40661 Transcript_24958/m.40661 type:complete len:88 (-) Transcript_24958:255-518(-)